MRCCAASSRLQVHVNQFINLDTNGMHVGAVHSRPGIFRGLGLHNISGEGIPTVGGKIDVRNAAVASEARRRLVEALVMALTTVSAYLLIHATAHRTNAARSRGASANSVPSQPCPLRMQYPQSLG